MNDVIAAYECGSLQLPGRAVDFADRAWNDHPAFAGVALKHLVTAEDTGGAFSFHLVRIRPGCAIGDHSHDPQLETHEVVDGEGVCTNDGDEITYRPGVISVFQPRRPHRVQACEKGLFLFAKFMPALC